MRRPPILAAVGPGLLVAATGVGAGDLATASIAGSRLGLGVLWAVVVGAGLKLLLNEGLTRWQLATGQTLLEGVAGRLGRAAAAVFLVYLAVWSLAVGRALVSACGVTAHALVPLFDSPETGKTVFGVLHSAIGVALVLAGGYRLVEKVMKAAVVLMFATVVVTAARLAPDVGEVARGLLVPTVSPAHEGGLAWTVALLGGVGGTVTILCYGYWIREEGRSGLGDLAVCRFDLGVGYLMTAVFGLAMVVVGSTVAVEGGGATLLVALGERLRTSLGDTGRLLFLIGAWGAVASSLLGVWQSVPYLFADLWRLLGGPAARARPVAVEGRPYRGFLLGLGLFAVAGLGSSFVEVQKVYAILGALFIPLLALALLVLNGRRDWVGEEGRNGVGATAGLVACLALFGYFAWLRLA